MALCDPCMKFVTKFNINDDTYYAKINWTENETNLFEIKIYEDEGTWTGKYSNFEADKHREHLRKSLDRYRSDIKKYLVEQNRKYIYEFSKAADINSATFKCSKLFDDVLVPYFSLNLTRNDSSESKNSLIDFLITENKVLKRTIEASTIKNQDLTNEVKNCKMEIEKHISLHKDLRDNLFDRFIQVLNEKKRRVVLLEATLQKRAS